MQDGYQLARDLEKALGAASPDEFVDIPKVLKRFDFLLCKIESCSPCFFLRDLWLDL